MEKQKTDYPAQHKVWLAQCDINMEETANNIQYYEKANAINKKLIAALKEQQSLNKKVRAQGIAQYRKWQRSQNK